MISIPINLVVEDNLSEVAIKKVLESSQQRFSVGACYGKHGFGYIQKRLHSFNNAAKGMPLLVLVDLESECPPAQINKWLDHPINPNLIFRIAVKEIESWILADRKGIASFLGISQKHIPFVSDEIADPKDCLINLARKSRKRQLRESLIPRANSTAKVGPDYDGQLSKFVTTSWNISEASKNSDSLRRCIEAINRFNPTLSHNKTNA